LDLNAWARESGFIIAVACTAAVWHGYLVPDAAELAHVSSAERRHRPGDQGEPVLTVLLPHED
jgi:hypothetical protein